MHHHFTVGVPTLVLCSTHCWVSRLKKDLLAQWQWKVLEHSPWFSRYEALRLWFVSEVEGTPLRQQSGTLAEMIRAAGQSITDIRTGPLMASSGSQKCGTRLTHRRTLQWRHIMIASNGRGTTHAVTTCHSTSAYAFIPYYILPNSTLQHLKSKWYSSKLTVVCVSCVGLWGPPMTRFCRCCGYCLRLVLGECPGLGPCESWGEPPNENLPICREDRLVGESVDGLTAWGLCTRKSTSCINKSWLYEINVYNINNSFSVYFPVRKTINTGINSTNINSQSISTSNSK